MLRFLSTLSLRRATSLLTLCPLRQCRFLSTLSLRRATGGGISHLIPSKDFYPRSPCGERPQLKPPVKSHAKISIHALLAESDIKNSEAVSKYMIFLSTLSLRRATDNLGTRFCEYCISIHALLAESDWSNRPVTMHTWRFLSTLSLRRATLNYFDFSGLWRDFYPRSPCGERLLMLSMDVILILFLSTLSLRRATEH